MRVEELAAAGLPRPYIDLLRERGIECLNPVQREAVRKGLFSDANMVVAAPTASGKTLIAEMVLVRNAVQGWKGVYLIPLRALANEKFEEFRELEKIGLSVGISTGDYDYPEEELEDKDIIVATYERFDSLLRVKPFWLKKVRLVAIDELHVIGDPERGPIVEAIAARMLKSRARVIGLSATISNAADLAEWLGAVLVKSDWRPVPLVEGFYSKRDRAIFFADGRREEVLEDHGERAIEAAVHSLKLGHQVIAFVHNRRKVEELAEEASRLISWSGRGPPSALGEALEILRESPSSLERERLAALMKRGVAYHHAGLSHAARRAVEEAFRSRAVGAVFATPTLAAGVNLPARRVLVSIKRYDPTLARTTNIQVFEYKQMAGRAGRPRYDEIGEAVILDARSREEAARYISSEPEPVVSKFLSARSMRVHTLALVASGDADTLEEALSTLSLTLGSRQYGDQSRFRQEVQRAIELLAGMGMLEVKEGRVLPTRLGKLTSYTYLDPLSVDHYLRLRPEEYSETAILHIITTTPDYARSRPHVPDHVLEQYEDDFLSSPLVEKIGIGSLSDYDLYNLQAGYVHALILRDWISELSEDEITQKYDIGPGDLYAMRETATWIASSLAKIERALGNLSLAAQVSALAERLEHGVKEDALELVRVRGIGRVRARVLINHGIRTLSDLAKTPKERLASLPSFGPRVAEAIHEELKRMGLVHSGGA